MTDAVRQAEVGEVEALGSSSRARYQCLADVLRQRIEDGVYLPGCALPVEAAIAAEHSVGHMTVRGALSVLRAEGLIRTQQGVPAIVRMPPARRRFVLYPHDRLVCRMPSSAERATLGVDVGVPVVEIRHAGGAVKALLPADEVEIAAYGR